MPSHRRKPTRNLPNVSPDDPEPSNDIEDAIIGMFRQDADAEAGADVRLGIGDDACILADGTAWTCDTLVEDVHWDKRLSAGDVGFKALAVSTSDLAAMGATANWALVAIALPPVVDTDFVQQLAVGLHEAANLWGIRVVGGDTTRTSGPIMITVTIGGRVGANPLLRSGGQVNDDLWVTGHPGLAAGGYLDSSPSEDALKALRRPKPPVRFARALSTLGLASAAMDLSDGLASDLPRLCRASTLGASIDPQRLPTHATLANDGDSRRRKLTGGDDYELLFSAPKVHRDAIEALARTHDVTVSSFGSLTREPTIHVAGGGWPTPIYEHFQAAQ